MCEHHEYILRLQNISKTYPGVAALSDVSIDFMPGEVHALLGENGAGKSTLIKCITGAVVPNAGCMIYGGIAYAKMEPAEARALGISAIYQEFNLFAELTVAENIFMGDLPGGALTVDKEKMRRGAADIFRKMGVSIAPDAIVKELSTGQMQMVEIARAMAREAKILIMDEPTASLTTADTEILFGIIRTLRAQGVCIIYISHRLNEVFAITDVCTIMRDGRVVASMITAETSRDQLIASMVGRSISESFPGHKSAPGEVVLEAQDLVARNVDHVSLKIRRGEILGMAGLVGAGRTETVRLLFGADAAKAGAIRLNGQRISIKSPMDAMKHGIALCPEDRKTQGVLLSLPIYMNITMPIIKQISRFSVVNRGEERRIVDRSIRALSIKAPSAEQAVMNLSGGNQQKVIIAKWLATDAQVLLFDEPTRGIDVAAKYEIYQLIYKLADEGKAVVVVSSDMEEIIGLCDRIAVFCEGQVMGELTRDEFSEERILDLASGHK